MKLKIYRILLLSLLFLAILLTGYFLVLSIINIIGIDKLDLMDGIMYILCFVLNLAFLSLEVFNTFYSFKTGSHFAKNLSFNEDGSLNKKFLIILSFIDVFVVIALVYLGIIYDGKLDIALSSLPLLSKSVSFVFFVTVFINVTFTLLFPILGKEDISLQDIKKTSEF